MTRRDIGLRARRTVGHSRRRARDFLALIQLVIGVTILLRGLRTAWREWSSVDDVEPVPVATGVEPTA